MLVRVDAEKITELLAPYLGEMELTTEQSGKISTYIDILCRWNERMNLTSVREPEEMVRRHFGESLFAARHLLESDSARSVIDVGSGAGFPGLPMKIFAPAVRLTLIEAHSKKNTFLREAARALGMTDVEVYLGRAEQFGRKAEVVTMRAVEKFEQVLPIAASLVEEGGSLGLLVGAAQVAVAKELLPGAWAELRLIPGSEGRVLAVRRDG